MIMSIASNLVIVSPLIRFDCPLTQNAEITQSYPTYWLGMEIWYAIEDDSVEKNIP